MLLEYLDARPRFVIFGAQVVAYGAYTAIRHCLYGRVPDCFAVTDPANNPAAIDGVPVRRIDTVPRDTPLVVGVTELVQKDVVPMLRAMGFRDLFLLTQHEEHLLMSAYYGSRGLFPPLEKTAGEGAELVLYEVRNHRDQPLRNPPALLPFERPIQAGAALSPPLDGTLSDDTGDSISAKNRQYCEMTAAYWVWKNTASPWLGIEHYRRHLLVRPAWLGGDIDAVLPLPYLCWPDETAQFRRFVSGAVLDALLQALRALYPADAERYLAILHGPYQYTYNLLCAKRAVFHDYCAWFFRTTAYMETMGLPEIAETRALSYVAEVLTNLYFMSRRDELVIRHAEKAIYV